MPYITEERRMIQEQAREFTLNEVLPVANKLDPEKGDIPMALREKMAEMGYFGILIPEEYGGLGLGCFEYCIVAEELSKAWMSVASIMARANGLIGMPVMTEEQRRNYLPRMARGDFIGCVSISEPDVGSDVSGIACRARRDGDSWVINGNKYWCTFADGADFMILMARTSEPTNPKRRHEGISCFMFEKPRGSFSFGTEASEWESQVAFDAPAADTEEVTVEVACRASDSRSETVLVTKAPDAGATVARVALMVLGPLLLGGIAFTWLVVLVVLQVVRRTERA